MRATLKDVARAAGVSPGAVSRVLNNTSDARVSPATRQRILKAARSLNYASHAAARSLRSGHSSNLGLVLPTYLGSSIAPFYLLLMTGISEAATVRGLELSLAFCATFAKEVETLERLAHSRRVDGFLLVGPRRSDPRISYLQREGTPFVVVGRPHRQTLPSVDTDNLQASRNLTEHLIALGHERIAYLAEPLVWTFSLDRLEGYRQALGSHAIPVQPGLLAEASFTAASGYRAAKRLLARHPDITAIAACDDVLALGAIRAARESGRRVPEDVSVVGCDDFRFTEHVNPPLTTIRIDAQRIGLLAAEMLADRLEDKTLEAQHVVVGAELIIRDSSAPAPPPRENRKRQALIVSADRN